MEKNYNISKTRLLAILLAAHAEGRGGYLELCNSASERIIVDFTDTKDSFSEYVFNLDDLNKIVCLAFMAGWNMKEKEEVIAEILNSLDVKKQSIYGQSISGIQAVLGYNNSTSGVSMSTIGNYSTISNLGTYSTVSNTFNSTRY